MQYCAFTLRKLQKRRFMAIFHGHYGSTDTITGLLAAGAPHPGAGVGRGSAGPLGLRSIIRHHSVSRRSVVCLSRGISSVILHSTPNFRNCPAKEFPRRQGDWPRKFGGGTGQLAAILNGHYVCVTSVGRSHKRYSDSGPGPIRYGNSQTSDRVIIRKSLGESHSGRE